MGRKSELTQAIDKIVGERIFILRITRGLSRRQLGDKIGVTHQQLAKYEKGTNRVSCGRIVEIAKALQESIFYFFEEEEFIPDVRRRLCIEASRNFLKIKNKRHQVAVSDLINSLANE